MDEDELVRSRQELSTFTNVMAPMVQSTLARVAAKLPPPTRPNSASVVRFSKKNKPLTTAPTAVSPSRKANDEISPPQPIVRPKTAAVRLFRSNQVSPIVDIQSTKVKAQARVARPKTASIVTSPRTPKREMPLEHDTNLQRAKLLANKQLRPKSAIVQATSLPATISSAKKRPRPPSAWTLMQNHAQATYAPLSPSGEVDRVSIDLTRKEIGHQREVTAAVHKRFNDMKHQCQTKQAELAHMRRQLATLTQESTATTAEANTFAGLTARAHALQAQIAKDKDQTTKCRHYKRILEHMLERTKLDSAAVVARTKTLHNKSSVVEREWMALDSRKYHYDNVVAHAAKQLEELRTTRDAARDEHAVLLESLRSEVHQSQELNRRRVEADRKRRNLVMTFRSPGEKSQPKLSRTNTQVLLQREADLTTREGDYDRLVAATHETDLRALVRRFLDYRRDVDVLKQLQTDGLSLRETLEAEHDRISAELHDLRACGTDRILETQHKVQGVLEDELWMNQASEERAFAAKSYHQDIVTGAELSLSLDFLHLMLVLALHQGLLSIIEWLECVAESRVTKEPLESLPQTCIQLYQAHLATVEELPTEALQEVFEQLPVTLWKKSLERVVLDDIVDVSRPSV
ncbi:unnamed protein product [Aphanomyces euteiches]|uniref:Uncharacterized protein n=1 Tax=Aphanomyces euteiches TaxID=100861 RepID=A0A6G0XC48_9STRA|nr:hypothetical protein Ae201684_006691 [Aphanomyces euteiches]